MAINREDVKLYESQRLTDENDGGGRATGNEVTDGTINNLFKDISRLDRTVGDVSLRKAFVGVNTNNQDDYLGAHAIIVDPPLDSNVHVVMFDAGSESDERSDAQQRIESYVVRGASAQWDLMGNQYEGQRQIVGVQREESTIPEVGEVYLLDDTASGNEQYVRITEVTESTQSFTVLIGSSLVDFERRRLDLEISAPLDFTFPGGEVRPEGVSSPHADVFATEVADAARYWGVTRSVDDVNSGDLGVKVDSIYSNLVPSAQAESPIIDQNFENAKKDVREGRTSDYNENITAVYIEPTQIRTVLNRPAVRGSVAITLGSSTYADDGSGTLTRSSGNYPVPVLTIDYATGEIYGTRTTGSTSIGATSTGTAAYRPGGVYSGKPVTLSVPVELSNRGYNWVQSFANAKPRPGTMRVSYMALGKWYTIEDDGSGVMSGVGTGSVSFITGTTTVTLEALPDVDSALLWSYIVDQADDVAEISGSFPTAGGSVKIDFETGAAPGSVVVTIISGGVSQTLDDTAVVGELAGYGEGIVDYAAGYLEFAPTTVPDDATQITVDYDYAANSQMVIASPSYTNGTISGTIPNAPLEPGSISIVTAAAYQSGYYGGSTMRNKTFADDGAGGFRRTKNDYYYGGYVVAGTINYATGDFSVELLRQYQINERRQIYTQSYGSNGRSWNSNYTTTSVTKRELAGGSVFINYQSASPSLSGGQTVVDMTSLELILGTPAYINNPVIPASILFTYGGKSYFDRDGIVYTDFDSQTGAGTAVGTIDYLEQTVSLTDWTAGAAAGVEIVSGLTVDSDAAVNVAAFRTPGAPLRPQSMTITVTDLDGNVINEQADVAGDITGASVQGTVNVNTGVVELEFTDGTNPISVFTDTGRYSTIIYSFLPLDAELIGLNPVRLPSDGRVPIFREGDVVVLSHTDTTSAGNPSAGSQVTLARDHLASVEIVGANDFLLDEAQYVVNKLTGVVTFADPLTLEDQPGGNILTTPLTIRDRVEHMTVINDAQITGELSFISPTGHDFPANDTIVSSALLWGDINSRYTNFFSQKTWYNDYLDDRVGDDTTGSYNDVDYPIEIANNGAVTEKWVLKFTSSTSFQVIGQNLGQVTTGTTASDVAPVNPNTGNPYFIIRSAGFGGGWSSGNAIRFDSEGCLAPVWLSRTVISGAAEQDDDKFVFQVRGDAD